MRKSEANRLWAIARKDSVAIIHRLLGVSAVNRFASQSCRVVWLFSPERGPRIRPPAAVFVYDFAFFAVTISTLCGFEVCGRGVP